MIRRAALIVALASAMLVPVEASFASTAYAAAGTGTSGIAAPSGTAARATVQVTVDQITPRVPRQPGTQIKIAGTVTNTGNTALAALRA